MEVTDELVNRFMRLTAGIVGSVKVCAELYQYYGDTGLQMLEEQGIRDGDIWFLYSRICDENILNFFNTLVEGNVLEKIKSYPEYHNYR